VNWNSLNFLLLPLNHRRVLGLLTIALLAGCAATPDSAQTSDSGGRIEAAGEAGTGDEGEAEVAAREQLRARYADAVALKQGGEHERARAEFLRMHEAHPELSGPAANLGIIAMEQDDRDQAIAYFRQATTETRPHPHALNALGVLAREDGAFDEAEDYYRRALAARPDFQPAIKNLAILLELYRGELEEALVLVERLQALQPEPDPTIKGWIFDLKNRIN
jgi:tetratricopeptide (TPR) repeat protein